MRDDRALNGRNRRLSGMVTIGFVVLVLLPRSGPLFAQAFDETEYGELSARFAKHFDAEQFREAEPIARRILDISPRLYPGKPLPHGKALHNLAEVLLNLGKLPEAESLAAAGTQKFRQVGEPGRLALADGLDLQGRIAMSASKYRESEEFLKQGLAIRENVWGPLHDHVGKSRLNLGALFVETGRFEDAEKSLKLALSIFERMLGPEHHTVAHTATNLGNLAHDLGRSREAEALHLRAFSIREKVFGAESTPASQSLQNLANAFTEQGRFAEAEEATRRALEINRQRLPAGHPLLGDLLNNLGNIADDQDRFEEAVAAYREALVIYEKAYRPEHPRVALVLNNLALSLGSLNQHGEAESLLRRAYDIRTKKLGAEHPDTLATRSNIASTLWKRGDYPAAKKADEELLQLRERVLGPHHPDVGSSVRNLAVTLRSLGELVPADELLTRAIKLAESGVAQPRDVARLYDLRARNRDQLGRRDDALLDLQKAIEQSELQRSQAGGGEAERATAFAQQGDVYERMIAWRIERNEVSEAWLAAERSRSRTLLDQIELRGGDLLAGVSWRIGRPLRKREAEARSRVARIEHSMQQIAAQPNLAAAERRRRLDPLEQELIQARKEAVEAYRDIRNASPLYRSMLAKDFQPLSPDALQSWLKEQRAVLLRYYLGREGSWLFVALPDQPLTVQPLSFDPTLAGALSVEPGVLTDVKLRAALSNDAKSGVLRLLHEPETAQDASKNLHTLWQALIPETIREGLLRGAFERLIVIPDGALAMLPFETLVTNASSEPRYLLDDGPPLVYAPSATLLHNLATREAVAEGSGVLTVGDPNYSATPKIELARGATATRYLGLKSQLPRLPFSGTELEWVSQSFSERGIPVKALRRDAATEAAIRQEVAKKRFVHLACHGLCDFSQHNFFGALAVTRGSLVDGAMNDGFLTLAEITELPLQSCELAILSACETNHGPQQDGEGVWALSRGFLGAGARRVIASDWLVDDEAAASLITRLCDGVANAQAKGQPLDVAAHLHAAKKAVRGQSKWSSPYYWGTFVLVGPP